ncbi:hypothetical protein J7384_10190 [Endozoicomonas sp. G2_1]|uniref:hypothetical protein n=1 Tax=Endozoicomonas sp. G2_1 TaxID=2821091 RepID=UPI001ADCC540|nr:hypothetical protein [Endozoicomonas sp. G2_1]MBO9490729.1 hypothetical protein [Endozoicomonas sp. G2_1]
MKEFLSDFIFWFKQDWGMNCFIVFFIVCVGALIYSPFAIIEYNDKQCANLGEIHQKPATRVGDKCLIEHEDGVETIYL